MEVFDIAALGTSLTAGHNVQSSYHRYLVPMLSAGKQSTIRTYNFGIPGGYTTTGMTVAPVAARLKPRVILIEYSMNDCLLPLATASANTISMLNLLKSASPGSLLYLMTMNSVIGSGSSITERANLADYYQIYRDLSVSQNVGLIDSFPMWSGVGFSEIPDGIHATAEAYRDRLLPLIVDQLSPLIS